MREDNKALRRLKRRHKKPIQQGVLDRIATLFIKPILKHRPEGQALQRWLPELWGTDERPIRMYHASKDFRLPGKQWLTPTRPVPGRRPTVRKGKLLFVRFESVGKIVVEGSFGRSRSEEVYQLTGEEWDMVRGNLVEHVPKPLWNSWEEK
jgi:hypothetical protein